MRPLPAQSQIAYFAIHAQRQPYLELERFADACFRSGRYGSVSEVTRAALRLLQEAEVRRAALLASVQEAEAEGEREGFLTLDEVAANVRSALDGATTQWASMPGF